MKKLILSGILLVTISSTHGQGTLVFANLASGVNAPVSRRSTGERITDPLFLADLYFSTTTNASTDTLQPAGFNVPFSTSTALGGGYFIGGIKTLTNVPGGTTILAQIRVWDSFNSTNYDVHYGNTGVSAPFLITLAQPPASAPLMSGLMAFGVGVFEDYRPIITKQPLTQNAASGATVYFDILATNPSVFPLNPSDPLFYQWYFSGTNALPGATNMVLTLTNVQSTQSGDYRAVVRNAFDHRFSSSASLGVIDPALEAPLVPALSVSNGVGSNFVLQAAASVTAFWTNVASLTPTNSPQLYVDGSATNVPDRLYRLVQVP